MKDIKILLTDFSRTGKNFLNFKIQLILYRFFQHIMK